MTRTGSAMDHEITVPWLLIATPQLMDPNFKKSVVLIVEHSESGAMGFIINRPCRAPLRELVMVPDVEIPPELPAWIGGPCDTATGIILHDGNDAGADFSLSQGISLSSSEETLELMLRVLTARLEEAARSGGQITPGMRLYPYRFLVGYSGWGPGQLEDELRSGAWIQAPVSRELLFDTPWPKIWDQAMASVGINPRILAPTAQPYLN